MAQSKRLRPILEIALAKEQMAARRMVQAQARAEAARQSLDKLRSIMDDYAIRFENTGEVGLGVLQAIDYRRFLSRINVAIEEQEKTLSQAERTQLTQRLAWEQTRSRTQGLQRAFEQAAVVENHRDRKREQAESDERAARNGAGSAFDLDD